ncbi:S-layer homology domain-containing protein [Lysinibacillus capsici]|uniref:S-layer homology domain-containing protein n=1 Tax=Lysinibacillus capsici TaxID=2115968 RepID=UPI003BAB511A
MAIVILLMPMIGSFVTFTNPTQVSAAATIEGQVMGSYQTITNNTYTGTVTEYTFSLNGVVQQSSTPPTNADWVTPSNFFDAGWNRNSWNEEFTYSNFGKIAQTNNAMSIPATATWATINSFQIEGTNQYAIGNTAFQYSVNGIDIQTTTNALNIPTNSMWATLVDFSDGWTKTINHAFTNYTVNRTTPIVKSLKISSNGGHAVYAKKGDKVTITVQTDLAIAAPVLKIAGVELTPVGNGTDWSASLELTDAVDQGNLSVSAVVFSDKGAPSTEITTTTDGSSVIYDNTNPNLLYTLTPNEATNQNVTVQINATDTISGVKLLKWAEGTQSKSYFTTGGTEFTNSFTANENGQYTIYARDNAGNETLLSVIVSNIDRIVPDVSLTESTTAPTNKDIEINAIAVDNVAISKQLWAEGLKNSSYFQTGEGTPFTNQFFAARIGVYTVYVEDTAGNFRLSTITVSNLFKQTPKLTLTSFPVLPTNKTVIVKVEVETEGTAQGNALTALRWAEGEQQTAFFASGGGANIVDALEFEATKNGIYSVYARDIAGNETVATITVNTPPVTTTGVVLSPKTGQLTVGDTQDFQLVENLSDGSNQDQTVNSTFTVSDSSIATIQNNKLTAVAPGTVTITATYGSLTDTATITVNTSPVTTTGVVLSPKTGQLTVGDTQDFQLVENLSDGSNQDQTVNTTFTVSDLSIATIQNNKLTAVAPGTVTITATYGSLTDTATITVNTSPVTTTGVVLSPKTGQLTVGDTQDFQLVENLSDGSNQDQTVNTTFTVSDLSIATIQNNKLTAVAPGTVTVMATYGSLTDTATITVNTPPVTTTGIVLSPKTGQLTVGDTQNFRLVENLSNGISKDQTGNTTFTVSDSSIATIQNNKLTAVAPGTVTVTATYGSSSDTATITVKKPTPVPPSVPQPVNPVEPKPSGAIDIIRTVEQGIVKYRADVSLNHVQMLVQQMTNQDARTIRLVYPAETATAKAYLNLFRNAGLFLYNQNTDLFIQTELAQMRIPFKSFDGVTEDVYFHLAPVKGPQQDMIHTNALNNEQIQKAMPDRAIISLLGTPVRIETNLQNRPVMITLPISSELTEDQIASLLIYVEHSDETTEVKHGRIVEFVPGVKGFQFEVDHFSTYSLVYTSEVQEAEEEVEQIAPYIQGFPDGTFKPNASVTRAQMATMLARFLTNGDIPTASATFKDTKNHPSKDAIELVKEIGLFNGITDTTFNPNGTITRAQMAVVAAHWIETVCTQDSTKFFCQASNNGKTFTDVSLNHWAVSAIEKVSALGIMGGTSASTFNPNDTLTRAQAVKVLNQLFERPALDRITTSSFKDVPSTHWAIREIEAAVTAQTIKK